MRLQNHCQDVSILLVGQNNFQHELLITSLKKIQDCRCTFTTVASLSGLHIHSWRNSSSNRMVYLDCYDQANHDIIDLLRLASQKILPETPIVLFNLDGEAGIEIETLNYGVKGFFYPHDTAEDFCAGTRAIQRGEIRLSRIKMSDKILSGLEPKRRSSQQEVAGRGSLSAREKEVLSLLGKGASNKTIAEALFISPHTVRTHLYKAYKKIKVSSRSQAMLWVIKNLSDT